MKKSILAAGLVAAVFIAILSGCARVDTCVLLDVPEYITYEEQTLTFTPQNKNKVGYCISNVRCIISTIDSQEISKIKATYDETSGTFSTDMFTIVKQGNDVILHVLENETPYLVNIIFSVGGDGRTNIYPDVFSVTQLPQGMTPDEIE